MNFYENFIRLCNTTGEKPSAVALKLGFSKSIVTRWKNGGGATDAIKLRVADYFGVPTSALTDEKPPAQESEGLDQQMLNIMHRLRYEDQVSAVRMMEGFAKSREETENEED